MISSEVQRTLVKSPPELWAELSDPESLARHLGELGEIRITRIEPEELVEWEAEKRTGKVQIKASAWGTRVTLTVDSEGHEACLSGTQPAAEPEHDAGSSGDDSSQADSSQADSSQAEQPAPPADSTDLADVEPAAAAAMEQEPGGELEAQPAEADEQLAAAEAETPDEEPDGWLADETPEPRRGFFARLFGRGLRLGAFASAPSDVLSPIQASSAPDVELASEDPGPEALEPPRDDQPHDESQPHDASEPALEAQAPEIEQDSEIAPQPEPEAEPETESGSPSATAPQSPATVAEGTTAPAEDAAPEPQAQDISAELKAAEETAAAHVTAVLTSVLDRLGAAHHRPFSRS